MPKRRRTTKVAAGSSKTPVTRSEMWMEDGSIVLQAEHTQFKVHRSALARVSKVFSDIFSMPLPSGEDETVDGCPVLFMQDTIQDVHHMLSILYDHNYITTERISFQVAASMIRMGSKYEIGVLWEEVVRRLRCDFPTTLSAWDNIHNTEVWLAFEEEADTLYDFTDFACSSDLMEVRAILPVAYYVCNTDSIETIIMGEEKVESEGVVKRRRPLSPEAQRVCLAGRQRLINRFDQAFSWTGVLGLGACKSDLRCESLGKTLVGVLWRPEPQIASIIDPWETLEKDLMTLYGDPIDLQKDLCPNCYNLARNSHRVSREGTWQLLPSFFGLPDWNVLTGGSQA